MSNLTFEIDCNYVSSRSGTSKTGNPYHFVSLVSELGAFDVFSPNPVTLPYMSNCTCIIEVFASNGKLGLRLKDIIH